VGMGLLALGLGVVALTSNLWVTLAGVVVLGYSLPLTFIAFMTMLQRRTPQRLMGRVSAAVETVMGAPQAVSLAVGALLVTLLDYHAIFGIMAAFTGAALVYLLISLWGQLFRPDLPLSFSPAEPILARRATGIPPRPEGTKCPPLTRAPRKYPPLTAASGRPVAGSRCEHQPCAVPRDDRANA